MKFFLSFYLLLQLDHSRVSVTLTCDAFTVRCHGDVISCCRVQCGVFRYGGQCVRVLTIQCVHVLSLFGGNKRACNENNDRLFIYNPDFHLVCIFKTICKWSTH